MKKVFSTAVIGLTLLGVAGSVFAATSSKNPYQADIRTLKQLHQKEANLNTQIKLQKQTINSTLAKKSAANLEDRKQVKMDMAGVKPLRNQLKSLKAQLKQAKQKKLDEAIIVNLKHQIKSIRTQIQTKVGKLKSQTPFHKKENKRLKSQLQPFLGDIKAANSELKDLGKQRKALYAKLKTDRQAKNKSFIITDLNKAISIEQSSIKLKQKLLQEEQQIVSILNK